MKQLLSPFLLLSLLILTSCQETHEPESAEPAPTEISKPKTKPAEALLTLDIPHPQQTIQRIFESYTQYQESTDSPASKDSMKQALHLLETAEVDEETLISVVNIWMYYTVTDFDTRAYTSSLLMAHKEKSIQAMRKRMENKMEWEREDGAPFSELAGLLAWLEKQ